VSGLVLKWGTGCFDGSLWVWVGNLVEPVVEVWVVVLARFWEWWWWPSVTVFGFGCCHGVCSWLVFWEDADLVGSGVALVTVKLVR
jgi:hypothetical protein